MRTARQTPNPFADIAIARRYEAWYTGAGKDAALLEEDLLGKLLALFPDARTVVDVGCGTGHFTRWLSQRGLAAVGLDAAEAMLSEALRLGGAGYVAGDALSLPFANRSWDVTAVITTLEFLPDPARALAEVVRVSRQGVLLGVLNRWSVLALRRRLSGKAPWRTARFFGPWELASMLAKAAGTRATGITWRTTLWPIPGVRDLPLPWGGFIGMAVQLRDQGVT